MNEARHEMTVTATEAVPVEKGPAVYRTSASGNRGEFVFETPKQLPLGQRLYVVIEVVEN